MKNPLPCFVCGTDLEHATGWTPGGCDALPNQPMKGTAFDTPGHYGSTLWDSFSDLLKIEIMICDACLALHPDRIREAERRASGTAYRQFEFDSGHGTENEIPTPSEREGVV